MDICIGALIFGAGVVGGVANAIAGGATLITFPAMLAAGLPPVIANASNAVAVTPGHFVAALADRSRLPPIDRRLVGALAAAVFGSALGAFLLLITPERLFTLLVPGLIGIATLVFAFGRQVQAVVSGGVGSEFGARRGVLLLPTSVYGGYFGAGLGVMLLAVLTVTGREEVREANALKNLLATAVSGVTVTIFIIEGVVRWPETIVMLAGSAVGGFLGARLIAFLAAKTVRTIIIAVGTGMAVIYAWRYWL